ncbi:MAG: PHP domain-containing protein [Planctomycetota bacterium]
MVEELEEKLDSFDSAERKEALLMLREEAQGGRIRLPERGTDVNLHCHTFFSYNTYGYSPSKFAWLARKTGVAVAGIVDFDVLDGLEEFLEAARILGLKGCVGMETRVFVPEFADKVMTSPGEPGITYHMGVGFPTAPKEERHKSFISHLKQTAQKRNQDLMERVNRYLSPAKLDYERDVVTLTPAGNPTERHICLAFARKAREVFTNDTGLNRFWTEKLGVDAGPLGLPEARDLLNTIRARTMKRGGVGYMAPDAGAFPEMKEINEFVLAAGGIPTLTWLDGTSNGEKELERLLEVAMQSGVAAINTIPDRNYKPGVKDEKLANLYQMVELAEGLHLPVVVGTEMNSPGQKFVDSFETAELSPLVPVFLKGAHIVYGHSVLQQQCGLGYMSEWARSRFSNTAEKSEFFEQVGRVLEPRREKSLAALDENTNPEQILQKLRN